MTHQSLGVALGLLLELGLLGILKAAGGGGEEAASDLGGHCDGICGSAGGNARVRESFVVVRLKLEVLV